MQGRRLGNVCGFPVESLQKINVFVIDYSVLDFPMMSQRQFVLLNLRRYHVDTEVSISSGFAWIVVC